MTRSGPEAGARTAIVWSRRALGTSPGWFSQKPILMSEQVMTSGLPVGPAVKLQLPARAPPARDTRRARTRAIRSLMASLQERERRRGRGAHEAMDRGKGQKVANPR